MADEAQQLKIEIDETPLPDQQVKIEPAAKPDDAVGDLKAQFAELEKKSDEDRKAREQAVARENQTRQELSRARASEAAAREALTHSNLDTINTALASAEAELDAAEKEAIRAGEAGDFVAQAAANRRIGRASAQIENFSGAKVDLEARKKTPPRQTEPSDPVEAYVANRTPRTASWLRDHPDYVTDEKKNQKLTGAHYLAISEGHQPDTDGYFEFVEQQVGLRDSDGEVPVRQHTRQKPNSRPVAPVGNNGGSGINAASGRSNTVTLTASEAAAAVDGTLIWNYNDPSGQNKFRKGDPIGVQEFARRKQAQMARGDYDKTFTG